MRVTALCLTGALLAVLLHRSGGEMALLLSLAVCGVAPMVLIEPLEELRDFWEDAAAWGELPAELFTQPFKMPVTDGSGNNRDNQRRALELLRQAGWVVRDRQMMNAQGQKLSFEILLPRVEGEPARPAEALPPVPAPRGGGARPPGRRRPPLPPTAPQGRSPPARRPTPEPTRRQPARPSHRQHGWFRPARCRDCPAR